MTTFTFPTPFVASGAKQTITLRKTSTLSPSIQWRKRESNPYPSGEAWTRIGGTWSMYGGSAVTDFDMIIGDAAFLYTRPAGFRFPYSWTDEGHIKSNIKFLEAQVSQYLHKHESANTPEVST
jgi:hypothetical protein